MSKMRENHLGKNFYEASLTEAVFGPSLTEAVFGLSSGHGECICPGDVCLEDDCPVCFTLDGEEHCPRCPCCCL